MAQNHAHVCEVDDLVESKWTGVGNRALVGIPSTIEQIQAYYESYMFLERYFFYVGPKNEPCLRPYPRET